MPQNQTTHQTNQINITNPPVGNNTYIERYPQMKFVQDPEYQIHANFKPEVTKIATRLAGAVRESVWDCQRSSTYTQEAFESSMKKHLKSVPKVTVVSYGIIQKIDQFGNPWQDWMDGKESFELLQKSLLKIPLKQGTANVQYVPLETEKEADNEIEGTKEEKEEKKKPWWERAWDTVKKAASDAWDTVTSKEFIGKVAKIAMTISIAAVVGVTIVGTAGSAGVLAGLMAGTTVTSLGGSAGLAVAATNVASFATTAGAYVIAGAVAADAVNTSVEVATGTNYIAKGIQGLFGNKNRTEEDFLNLYGEGRDLLYMGAYGYGEFGANAMAAGYSSRKSVGGTESVPGASKLTGAGEGEQFGVYASKATPVEGYSDVIVHGAPPNQIGVMHNGKWIYLDQRSLANYLRQDQGYSGGPIRLLSCGTGSTQNGFAQNLANKMGVEVMAPSDTIWAFSNGKLTIGPKSFNNTGQWNIFRPGNH